MPAKESVILLHGIFRTRRCMAGLADYCAKTGFAPCNIGYPSTRHTLEALADIIHPTIQNHLQQHTGKVSFIGYSMGGLLARTYIAKYRPAQLHRVVLLATPNQGSEVADYIQYWKPYQWLYGPAGQQLITRQKRFSHILGTVDYELGVIAGNKSVDPLSSWIIGQPNDGKVSVASTKLAGMKEHMVLSVDHMFFPSNKSVWRHTLRFLQTGSFAAPSP